MTEKTNQFNVTLPFGGVWNPVLGIVPILPLDVVVTSLAHEDTHRLEYRVIYINDKQLSKTRFLFLTSDGFLVEEFAKGNYSLYSVSVDNYVIKQQHSVVTGDCEFNYIPVPVNLNSGQTFTAFCPPDKTEKHQLTYIVVWRKTLDEVECATFSTLEDARRNITELEKSNIKTILVPVFI